MTYAQAYTELDGKWHAIGPDETTVCGLVIPHGNGYGPLPDGKKAHCGAEPEEDEAEAPTKPTTKATKVNRA